MANNRAGASLSARFCGSGVRSIAHMMRLEPSPWKTVADKAMSMSAAMYDLRRCVSCSSWSSNAVRAEHRSIGNMRQNGHKVHSR